MTGAWKALPLRLLGSSTDGHDRGLLLLPILFVFGCSPDTAADSSAVYPNATDSPLSDLAVIPLIENDTFFVGRPRALAVAGDSLFIADSFSGRVLVFDSGGRPLTALGGPGQGPGEIQQIGPLALGPMRVAVADLADQQVQFYDRATGAFSQDLRYEGMTSSLAIDGDRLWTGGPHIVDSSSVRLWSIGDGRRIDFGSPFPQSYAESNPLYSIYNIVPFAMLPSGGIAIGFAGSDVLYHISQVDGRMLDSIRVPRRQRRGVPADFAETITELPFPEMFSGASMLFHVFPLSGQHLLLIHHDQFMASAPSGLVSSETWGTVLADSGTTRCVDFVLRPRGDGRAQFAMVGDTLFQLEQSVEEGSAATRVRKRFVDTGICKAAGN